jgi:dihydroorotate dehydrogenase
MAAGFDKNAVAPDALLRSGFAWVECGTVTPRPQVGNPQPRLFRLTSDRAVINRMGFNNDGLEAFVARLRERPQGSGVVGANVGANKDSPDRVADYVQGMRRVWPHASYVTANVSSPNTPGLRGLQERGALQELLGRLDEARVDLVAMHGPKPLFLKVAPDLDDAAIEDIAEIAVAFRLDGLIVSNTTIERPMSLISPDRDEAGGLSGRPLFRVSTLALRRFAAALDRKLPLIGVGGVDSGEAALAKIKAGASAVQLYSALVYDGPDLAARIARDLDVLLEAEGFKNVSEAVGYDRL